MSLCVFIQLMIMPFVLKLHRKLEVLRVTALIKNHPNENYLLNKNKLLIQRKDRKKYILLDRTQDLHTGFIYDNYFLAQQKDCDE